MNSDLNVPPTPGGMNLDTEFSSTSDPTDAAYTPGAGFEANPYDGPSRRNILVPTAGSTSEPLTSAQLSSIGAKRKRPAGTNADADAATRAPGTSESSHEAASTRHREHPRLAQVTPGMRPGSQSFSRTTQHKSDRTDGYSTSANINRAKASQPANRHVVRSLKEAISTIKMCGKTQGELSDTRLILVRNKLHPLPFLQDVNLRSVLEAKFLDPEGLSVMWEEYGAKFPPAMKALARELHKKWSRGDFDPVLHRGFARNHHQWTNKSTDRVNAKQTESSNPKLEPDWNGGRALPGLYEGHGDLEIGQWWASHGCCWRDGGHGQYQAGISGDNTRGAVSIVMSEGSYEHDKDWGDEILYSGTVQTNLNKQGQPTAHTEHMELARARGTQIRVFRSAKKGSKEASNGYRPSKGIRYDGLYTIVESNLVDDASQLRTFRMRRLPGQFRPWVNKNGTQPDAGLDARPTKQELKAWEKEDYIKQLAKPRT